MATQGSGGSGAGGSSKLFCCCCGGSGLFALLSRGCSSCSLPVLFRSYSGSMCLTKALLLLLLLLLLQCNPS